MSNQLIKRVSIGGYVKADTTGTGNWEVGKIEKFDDKFVWFKSTLDGQEVRVTRQGAYKATAEEFKAEAAKHAPASKEASRDVAEIAQPKAVDSETAEIVESLGLKQDAADEGGATKTIVEKGYLEVYFPVKSANGHSSRICGDDVSRMLVGKTVEEVAEIVEEYTGWSGAAMLAQYAHLNPGQQRMCIGNRFRTWVKVQAAATEARGG